MAEPNPSKIPSYLDQLIRESQRDIPVVLPPASLLIEAVKDLQDIIDAQEAQILALDARVFALENP